MLRTNDSLLVLNNVTMLIKMVKMSRHEVFNILLVLVVTICVRFEVTERQIKKSREECKNSPKTFLDDRKNCHRGQE